MSLYPLSAAQCRAVIPLLLLVLGLAPASNRAETDNISPNTEAAISGVLEAWNIE